MKRWILFIVLGLSSSPIWLGRSVDRSVPGQNVSGKEVNGIQASVRVSKARFVKGDSVVPVPFTRSMRWTKMEGIRSFRGEKVKM
jgi:hypothetical protein